MSVEKQENIWCKIPRNQLQGLHQKMQSKNRKEVTKKHPSGTANHINNTEEWHQNDQFAGNVLLPRYKRNYNKSRRDFQHCIRTAF